MKSSTIRTLDPLWWSWADIVKHADQLGIPNFQRGAVWIQADAMAESQSLPDQAQSLGERSQALREFKPGESFECLAAIYNAKTEAGMQADLESQVVLFNEGNELFKSEPEAVRLSSLADSQRIPIKKSLLLDNALQPGDYVLKLQVRDRHVQGENSVAEQLLQFKVLGK